MKKKQLGEDACDVPGCRDEYMVRLVYDGGTKLCMHHYQLRCDRREKEIERCLQRSQEPPATASCSPDSPPGPTPPPASQ